jgi:hypothetical protein
LGRADGARSAEYCTENRGASLGAALGGIFRSITAKPPLDESEIGFVRQRFEFFFFFATFLAVFFFPTAFRPADDFVFLADLFGIIFFAVFFTFSDGGFGNFLRCMRCLGHHVSHLLKYRFLVVHGALQI